METIDTTAATEDITQISPEKCEETKKIEDENENYPPLHIGIVSKLSTILQKQNERYFLLNPYEGKLLRYKFKKDYPMKPKEVTFLSQISDIKEIGRS